MKPCVRCLSKKIKKIRSGHFTIVQCDDCGFNVTASNLSLKAPYKKVIDMWNGFKVWTLVKK